MVICVEFTFFAQRSRQCEKFGRLGFSLRGIRAVLMPLDHGHMNRKSNPESSSKSVFKSEEILAYALLQRISWNRG